MKKYTMNIIGTTIATVLFIVLIGLQGIVIYAKAGLGNAILVSVMLTMVISVIEMLMVNECIGSYESLQKESH